MAGGDPAGGTGELVVAAWTKTHFDGIAGVIRQEVDVARLVGQERAQRPFSEARLGVCRVMACHFADIAERENPRFDRARFLKACGVLGE